jgi:geranylgeranyl diphosphate synthase type I
MNSGQTAPTTSTGTNAFLDLLARIRPEIERRIESRFDAKVARTRTYGPDVAAMVEAARDLTVRGGKRFRAGLIAAGFLVAAGEGPLEAAIDAGVAFELLQTYLLIQDDWMDGDTTRRGGPSVHAALTTRLGDAQRGASSAILASDLTWGLALETLSSIDLPAPRLLEVFRLFLRVHEDVVIGQQIDMLGKAEDVEAMHDLKTGSYTVRGPLLLGAALAGAPNALREGLVRFAAPIGIAFQLRDDLLGTFGDPAETGKPVGNDLVAGKRTALVAEAHRLASENELSALVRVLGRPDASEGEIRTATTVIVSSGARRAVEDRLHALCDEAEAISAGLDVSAAGHALLMGAVAALRVPRSKGAEARA